MLVAGLPWHQLITTFPQLLKHYPPKQQVQNLAQFARVDSLHAKQDHQRWGYSTVIHLEKTIFLAKWKDLNKEKRK